MFDSLSPQIKTFLAITGGVALLAVIGYLTEGSEQDTKKKKRQQFSGGVPDLGSMSLEEQQEFLKTLQQQGQPGRENVNKQQQEIMEILGRAEIAKNKGQLDVAEKLYEEAIDMLENDDDFGPNHHYVGLTSYALSLVVKQREDYDKAEAIMTKAIKILEKVKTPEAADQIADALATLADLLITTKKFEEAEVPLQRSINIVYGKLAMINEFNPRNSEEAHEKSEALQKINQELGILYDTQSKLKFEQKLYNEAEDIGKKALMLLMSGFGNDQSVEPFIQRSVLRMAEILLAQGKSTEAGDIYSKMIQEQEDNLSNDLIPASYCRLASNTSLQYQQYSLAIQFAEKALQIYRKHPENPKAQTDRAELLVTIITIHQQLQTTTEIPKYLAELQELLEESVISLPLNASHYLRTDSASTQFFTDKTNNTFAPYFTLTLTIRGNATKDNTKLPDGTLLSFQFPCDSGVTHDVDFEINKVEENKSIVVQSPHLSGLSKKLYFVPVTIYSDSTKTNILGYHAVIISSPLDTESIQSVDELEELINQ